MRSTLAYSYAQALASICALYCALAVAGPTIAAVLFPAKHLV